MLTHPQTHTHMPTPFRCGLFPAKGPPDSLIHPQVINRMYHRWGLQGGPMGGRAGVFNRRWRVRDSWYPCACPPTALTFYLTPSFSLLPALSLPLPSFFPSFFQSCRLYLCSPCVPTHSLGVTCVTCTLSGMHRISMYALSSLLPFCPADSMLLKWPSTWKHDKWQEVFVLHHHDCRVSLAPFSWSSVDSL